jgi:endonuclease YncB( thermonuclease family)
MRGFLAICCVAGLVWIAFDRRTPQPEAALMTLVPTPLTGRVQVIDGDTIDMGGVRIRLQGVDAPERRETCRDAAGRDWSCGSWAGEALRALIADRPLACRDLGERTHDRVVAACTLDGRDLGALLVAEGIVRACPRYARQHPHSRGYEAIEVEAIAARRGLHAGTTPPRARFCEPRGGA